MIQERRRWPRVQVELPCEVQLLILGESFEPRIHHGCIIDLSVRGAKVRISGLPKEVFKKLLRPDCYVKLIFSTPESEGNAKVIGKIVWMDYNSKQQLLEIGTYFEKVEPQEEKMLQQIVEQAS